jgi:hypothetical protein
MRASSTSLLMVLAYAGATPQIGAQALPASVIACADEPDAAKRLSCYDREVKRFRTAASDTTASAASAGVASAGVASPGAAATGAAGTGSATTAPVTPRGSAGPAAAPSASAVDSFGMTGELQRKEGAAPPPKLDKLTAHITGVSYKPYGKAIVTLENGQVWEEAEAGMHLPLRSGDVATIERGLLGAFYMSTAHVLGVRVKRVH